MNKFLFLLLLLSTSIISNAQLKDSIIEVTSDHLPKQFICNNVPCTGIEQGYYSNGIIEIAGRFRKGKAVGEVRNYTLTGQIETIRYFRKGDLQRSLSYDPLGRLTRDLNWRKKEATTYFYDAGGQAIKKEVFIWKNVGWSNGVTEIYEKKNEDWVKINRS